MRDDFPKLKKGLATLTSLREIRVAEFHKPKVFSCFGNEGRFPETQKGFSYADFVAGNPRSGIP
ncbi:hypothetical protein PN36_10985 [Candidatus Thiomargarita nelsonii]|uniref:Uncharacterized protein n=1 Tax=Candidatus Thiomargarita nelsonii TaxID=1003181 RepID=A0A4E0R3A8_9GAMM|nr:hypothetical protein PN36_10985 [Candidatus Thiomargarita nelsonii]